MGPSRTAHDVKNSSDPMDHLKHRVSHSAAVFGLLRGKKGRVETGREAVETRRARSASTSGIYPRHEPHQACGPCAGREQR